MRKGLMMRKLFFLSIMKREAALPKVLTAIFFGLLLIVGVGTESAQSGEVTFKLTNNAPYNVMVKFFSQNRNHYWPGATRHYNLDDSAQHAFRA